MAKPTHIAARAAAPRPRSSEHEWIVVEKAHSNPDEDLLRCARCSALSQRTDATKGPRCIPPPAAEPVGYPRTKASFAAGLGAGRVILTIRETDSSTTEPLFTLPLGREDTFRILREISRASVRAFEPGRRDARGQAGAPRVDHVQPTLGSGQSAAEAM